MSRLSGPNPLLPLRGDGNLFERRLMPCSALLSRSEVSLSVSLDSDINVIKLALSPHDHGTNET